MQRHQIPLIVTLVCLFAVDVGAATPPVDPAAEPDTLRLDTPKVAPSASTPPAVAEGAIRGNPLWAIPLNRLRATRERPLFVPSRRPPAPVVANAPRPASAPIEKPPETEPLQLSLVGTVAGEKGALGVFLDKAGGTPLRLKVGEAHKGWTLRSVGRRDVVLAKGTTMTKLAMAEPTKPKGVDAAKGLNPARKLDSARGPDAATGMDPAKGLDPAKVAAPPEQANSHSSAMARMIGAGIPKLDPTTLNIFRLSK